MSGRHGGVKIQSSSPISSKAAGRSREAAAPGFALPADSAAPTAAAARTATAAPAAALGALLAAQSLETPAERRRKAAARGGRLLDVLDQVRIGLLEGRLAPSQVERLAQEVRAARVSADDPGLQGVLDEIEVRAAVELAKLQRAP